MSAEYMHIGIPITNKKPGMTYNEGAKFWVSNVDDYDYKIEYLKFEEGTPFPEVLHRCPHVAYKVDSLEKYIADADSVICGPMQANDQGDQLAFVWKDGAILELYQPKSNHTLTPPPRAGRSFGSAPLCCLPLRGTSPAVPVRLAEDGSRPLTGQIFQKAAHRHAGALPAPEGPGTVRPAFRGGVGHFFTNWG